MNLAKFLEKKGAEYAPFDPNRAPQIFELFAKDFLPYFHPKVIHIVGTNGKGSTGRMIARGLKNVLHFTSPHLFCINERFYLNGENIALQALEDAHTKLYEKKYMHKASYFEYLTFLCLYLAKDCAYLILEAGLGGEFDSTNVIREKISVFTQIGLDHCEILGESLEQIATTKLNSMGRVAFLGIQKYPQVQHIAKNIAQSKKAQITILKDLITPPFAMPEFLVENLTLASEVLDFLNIQYNLAQIAALDLQGRMQKYSPLITLDVGHNPDGARAILKEFMGKKIILIYNAYKQKDVAQVLCILSPIIKEVQIIPINDPRAISKEELKRILKELGLKFSDFKEVKRGEEILVFGSFSVVKAFLESVGER
ncbi:glutamate ligase domain-containing protein [Helicobacter cholecystus]|uniref:glutamate ligase domain-containing protein n=1 Tax=Helicobacter cholecystus TaxID=45498 RepID=UPI0027399797|nr:Mur ligase family protein [Helicobacter cholecystus]